MQAKVFSSLHPGERMDGTEGEVWREEIDTLGRPILADEAVLAAAGKTKIRQYVILGAKRYLTVFRLRQDGKIPDTDQIFGVTNLDHLPARADTRKEEVLTPEEFLQRLTAQFNPFELNLLFNFAAPSRSFKDLKEVRYAQDRIWKVSYFQFRKTGHYDLA